MHILSDTVPQHTDFVAGELQQCVRGSSVTSLPVSFHCDPQVISSDVRVADELLKCPFALLALE